MYRKAIKGGSSHGHSQSLKLTHVYDKMSFSALQRITKHQAMATGNMQEKFSEVQLHRFQTNILITILCGPPTGK